MFIVTVICVRSYEKRNPYLLFEIWASAAFVQRKSPVIVMETLDKTTSLGAFSSKACTSGVRPINCNDFISRWLKQRINYIEKSSKEHTELFETQNQLTIASQNDSLFRIAPIGSRFASHLNQNRTSKLVSRVIWIRTGLQSSFRESFESERDFKARFASHLNQNGTSKLVSRVIWIITGLQSSFRESPPEIKKIIQQRHDYIR